MPNPPEAEPAALNTARWLAFVTLLLAATIIGTFAQFIFGALGPFIIADFDISRTQFGLLSGTFYLVAAGGSVVAGKVVDRVRARVMLVALLAITGMGFVSMALAPSFRWLLAAVVAGGLGTAIVNPLTNQLIAHRLPQGRQGAVTGVKQSGVQVSAFIAGAALPTAALTLGWRSALVAAAFVAGAVLLFGLLILPDVPSSGSRRAREPLSLPDVRFLSWLSAYSGLMGFGVAAAAVFLVLYAVESLGMSEVAGGMAAAVLGLTSVVVRIVQGRVVECLRSPVGMLIVIAIGAIIGQIALWSAPRLGPWVLWVGVVILGATAASWNAVGMVAIVQRIELSATGFASGVVQSTFFLGLLLCPLVFGWTVDVSGSYDWGWGLTTVAYVLALIVALGWRGDSVARGEHPACSP